MFKAHAPSASQRQLLQPARRNKEISHRTFPSERAFFPVCLVACFRLWSVRHVIRFAQLVVDVILRLPCSFNHGKPLGQVMLSNFTAVRHAGQELQKPLYTPSKLRKQTSCRQEGSATGLLFHKGKRNSGDNSVLLMLSYHKWKGSSGDPDFCWLF